MERLSIRDDDELLVGQCPEQGGRYRSRFPPTLGFATVWGADRRKHHGMRVSPRYRHYCDRCTCLGQATLNDQTADLFVCEDLVVARYGDEPGEAEAEHIHNLAVDSSAFLLAAYRLYQEESGKSAVPGSAVHPAEPLQS